MKFVAAVCALKDMDFEKKFTPIAQGLWLELAGEIPLEELRRRLNLQLRTMTSKTYFPTPGDIRALGEKANEAEALEELNRVVKQLEEIPFDPGAGGWLYPFFGDEQRARAFAEQHNLEVIEEPGGRGWQCKPKPLSPETQFAVDYLGGFDRIRSEMGGRQHDFIRRNFLEAYALAKQNPRVIGAAKPRELEEAKRG